MASCNACCKRVSSTNAARSGSYPVPESVGLPCLLCRCKRCQTHRSMADAVSCRQLPRASFARRYPHGQPTFYNLQRSTCPTGASNIVVSVRRAPAPPSPAAPCPRPHFAPFGPRNRIRCASSSLAALCFRLVAGGNPGRAWRWTSSLALHPPPRLAVELVPGRNSHLLLAHLHGQPPSLPFAS